MPPLGPAPATLAGDAVPDITILLSRRNDNLPAAGFLL
jgi:hypothetical protein